MARSGGCRKKKPCDCCKRYFDHLDEKNQPMSYFFGRMDANSKHSMIVPNRFVKHFAGKLLGRINLEAPNGSLYDVEVTDRYDKTVLQCGWEAFVDANHIQENDFMLFRHIKESHFEVLILDSDGCEKVFPCAGIRNTPITQERSLHSVDISSSSCHDTTDSTGNERFARRERSGSSRHKRTAKMAATSLSCEETGYAVKREDSPGNKSFGTPPRDGYVLSCRRYLSEAQREKVTALIQEIKPEITVFVSVMQKCNTQTSGPYLDISKEYALAHFPHETTYLTLQRPGKRKKWHPRFYIKDRRTYMLIGRWLDFVRDNHLQEGDICLFLPSKTGRKFMLTVYLLRATETHSRRRASLKRVGPCSRGPNAKISGVKIKEEPTDGERVSSEGDMHEISHEYLEREVPGGPSHPPYFLPSKCGLSKPQKKIVEERVRAIQRDVPIYVAIMRQGNIAGSARSIVELGSQYAAAVHLPARGQTMVLQCRRKMWNTKMAIYARRRYLISGWLEFVRGNGLRVGDVCLFELKKNKEKLTMEVHIIPREQL